MDRKIKQRDITDCGAACLASVAAHYKSRVSVAKIRQFASTDKKGTNVLGMIEAAGKMHFEAKGVRGNFESLSKIPLPSIAHVIMKGSLQHYVVIYNVSKKYIKVMDPAFGRIVKKTHEDFKKEWTGILIILIPHDSFRPGNSDLSLVGRFLILVKPHRGILLQLLFGSIIYTILGLSTSIFLQKIVDNVLVNGNRNLLNLMGLIMVIILALKTFIQVSKAVFSIRTGQQIDANLILGYYKHLLRLPQQFFDTMRVGEIISRINDAVKIRAFINDAFINLSVNIFIVLFSFMLMFTYYYKLALIMLGVVPVYLLIFFITNKVNKSVQRLMMEEGAELESQLVESISTVSTIKRFGLESFANTKTEHRFIKLLRTLYKSGLNVSFSGISTETVAQIFTIILLWFGASSVIEGDLTPGELLSFYSLIGYFNGPAANLIGVNKTIQDAIIAADRLFEIMDLETESDVQKFQFEIDELGDIRFENVAFRYGSRKSLFESLNLVIPAGKFTAIIGESGSGKSTILALLQNIYSLQSGSIYIGNRLIESIKNQDLRKIVGVVPQKVELFSGTIVENIAVGEYEPNMGEIFKICQELGIRDFIESLSEGFNTQVGENGVTLSGGQKQRIAIARALYRKPEILLLDEATSSLDSHAENYVQTMIQFLSNQGKTIVIIAHRLSTIRQADNIVVIEKGMVVEQGTHAELICKQETYYKLWNEQYPAFV